jgi:hypothetical protein
MRSSVDLSAWPATVQRADRRNIQRNAVCAVDPCHQLAQLFTLFGSPRHQHNLHSALNNNVHGMQHHPPEVGLGQAIQAKAGRLKTIKHHVVHGEQGGAKHNHLPLPVHQQQGQRHEHAKVKLQHAPRQLDVQRHQADQHKGKHITADRAAFGPRVSQPRHHQQRHGGANGQPRIHKLEPQNKTGDGTESDRQKNNPVTKNGRL